MEEEAFLSGLGSKQDLKTLKAMNAMAVPRPTEARWASCGSGTPVRYLNRWPVEIESHLCG